MMVKLLLYMHEYSGLCLQTGETYCERQQKVTGELLSGNSALGAHRDRAPLLIALTSVVATQLSARNDWCCCVTVIMRQKLCWPTVRGSGPGQS